jgi:rubrerythrin
MKKSIFKFSQWAMFIAVMGSSVSAFCHSEPVHSKEAKLEKMYVDLSNIHFDQKDMYVYLNEEWVGTNAIYSDAEGFYIIETQGGWTCGSCGYYNEGNNWTCDDCGRRRD